MARSERDGRQAALQKDYWREADARAVVEAWRRSGQPLSRFARGHGLQPQRLSRWAARLDGNERSVRFHPVRVVRGEGGDRREAIEVVLVDGLRVRVPAGFAAADLERVLAVLEGRG